MNLNKSSVLQIGCIPRFQTIAQLSNSSSTSWQTRTPRRLEGDPNALFATLLSPTIGALYITCLSIQSRVNLQPSLSYLTRSQNATCVSSRTHLTLIGVQFLHKSQKIYETNASKSKSICRCVFYPAPSSDPVLTGASQKKKNLLL